MNTAANQQKRSLNKKPSKLLKLAKETSKLVKRTALDAILLKMRQTKNNNEGRLPKGFVTDIVREMSGEFPWLNPDKINYHYQTWTKQKTLSESENDVNTGTVDKNFASNSIITHIPRSDDRNKGGRPKGTTNVTKKQVADSVTAALNEITKEYKKKKSEGPMKKGVLASIIASVKRKRSLPDDVSILPDTIRRRV